MPMTISQSPVEPLMSFADLLGAIRLTYRAQCRMARLSSKSGRSLMKSKLVITLTAAMTIAGMASAAEIKVLSTQATSEAYGELVPQFEKASGHKVTTIFTGTLDVNKRLTAGEKYDLIIMSGTSIDQHIKDGKIAAGTKVNLAKSGVGVAVKAGAKKPDISTVAALKKTLLDAKSIGYSTGPSG